MCITSIIHSTALISSLLMTDVFSMHYSPSLGTNLEQESKAHVVTSRDLPRFKTTGNPSRRITQPSKRRQSAEIRHSTRILSKPLPQSIITSAEIRNKTSIREHVIDLRNQPRTSLIASTNHKPEKIKNKLNDTADLGSTRLIVLNLRVF